MDNIEILPQHVRPWFDIESFMLMCGEKRLDGSGLETLARWHDAWLELLNVRKITAGSRSWLALWLPESVEDAVDAAWKESPDLGFRLNSLALYLSMSALRELVPQVEAAGCAPSPEPDDIIERALERAGLPYRDKRSGQLGRRYAVLTHYPFRGGCEVCHMRESCHKGQPAGLLLAGHEPGR